ncbi:uncharacterized protein LOC143175446 [Nomia melanderi]|uniref:uncharacterized protein LOC143175446 n=1 Tax=Nomia melanderi TaxID=2448451 RepID=UPI003FCC8D62
MTFEVASLEAANRKTTNKMKVIMLIMTLLLAVSAIFAFRDPIQRPGRPGPTFPFPGTPPFNPKQQWPYPYIH